MHFSNEDPGGGGTLTDPSFMAGVPIRSGEQVTTPKGLPILATSTLVLQVISSVSARRAEPGRTEDRFH